MARLKACDRQDKIDDLLARYRVSLMVLKVVRWQLEGASRVAGLMGSTRKDVSDEGTEC